ncbi:serine hydrolase [Pedobacter alluvionis]|uniref:CubicO group peptidase (Beta-lactamase class C family) n=1 Tax=Pedobacter alluvionis TaxID=475253 RepID=A0A497XVA9_9SPHI|nr:serine hydrolase [Pedobacter alluvionis]RLJ73685.1 CubicO group peptidase (beta-lactamase class C family) [Pedobacter alluvionis]TFB32690.1 serine hydrolase [Pedobacter alluvionis]
MKNTETTHLDSLNRASQQSYKLTAALVLFFLVFIVNTTLAQSTVEDRIKQVENGLTENIQISDSAPFNLLERMKHFKVQGLSIAVIKDYKVDFAKGYGFADTEKKIRVSDKTLFQAASISKSLNSLAILKLFKDRDLDVYADINTYLKSWKFPYDSISKGKKINMANLLSHTAGLNVHGFGGYEAGKPLPSVIQILNGESPANSDAVRSLFVPGTRQEYSGGGTTISQLVLTDITGEKYESYLREQVLKPLGMLSSTFAQPPLGVREKLLSAGYDGDGKEVKGKYHIYPEQAAAGLWTNPSDLAKYIIETQLAYQGKSAKVLDQQTTKLRLSPYMNKNGAAFGVFVEDYNGVKYFGHGAGNAGFTGGYYGSFEGGNGLIIMVNSDNGEIIQELINSISTVYGFKGLSKTKKVTLAEVPEQDLNSYPGNYQLTPQLVLTVSREGKKVFVQATGQPRIEAFAESSNKFFFKTIQASMEFVKDQHGLIKEMIFIQGQTIHAKKL